MVSAVQTPFPKLMDPTNVLIATKKKQYKKLVFWDTYHVKHASTNVAVVEDKK